jgi:hypothetical protein
VVTKPTGRPAHRPKGTVVPVKDDPDRYRLARVYGMKMRKKDGKPVLSTRKICEIIAREEAQGAKVGIIKNGIHIPIIEKNGPIANDLSDEKLKVYYRLLTKINRYNDRPQEDRDHLEMMAKAWVFANYYPDLIKALAVSKAACEIMNEFEWFERELQHDIARRFFPLADPPTSLLNLLDEHTDT